MKNWMHSHCLSGLISSIRHKRVSSNPSPTMVRSFSSCFFALTLPQPPRAPPKFYELTIRTHRLALLLSKVAPTTTISELKSQILSATRSTAFRAVPEENAISDAFELCRGVRDKEAKARGVVAYRYEVLDDKATVKSLNNWETLYIQFKDPSGA